MHFKMLRSAFPLVSKPTEGDARRSRTFRTRQEAPFAAAQIRRAVQGDAAAHRTAAESLIAGGLCFLCIVQSVNFVFVGNPGTFFLVPEPVELGMYGLDFVGWICGGTGYAGSRCILKMSAFQDAIQGT